MLAKTLLLWAALILLGWFIGWATLPHCYPAAHAAARETLLNSADPIL